MTTLTPTMDGRKIIVCVGSGGVGKTTTSAAIALRAAIDGARVCVLTIDPARRLANALGLEELGNVEKEIEPELFEAAGLPRPAGNLYAMMLDTKRSWDDVVTRYAVDDEHRERIFNNSFYKQISTALSGSHEYMAMEKVYDLHEQGKYDLLVVDTPPTKHALDFLDAPKRLINFLDERILRWFMAPGGGARRGFGLLASGGAWVLKLLERVTGVELLRDLSEFFQAFQGMYKGFTERAQKVYDLMRADVTTFVLVTSPNPLTLEEAEFFFERLEEYEMPFGGFVVNKVHPRYLEGAAVEAFDGIREDADALLRALGHDRFDDASRDVARRLAANLDDLELLAARDRRVVDGLGSRAGAHHPMVLIPFLDEDVHDLGGLHRIQSFLFAEPESRKAASR